MNTLKVGVTGLTLTLASIALSSQAMAQTQKLTLQVTPTTFASNAGPQAATGTVSRPTAANTALTVTLKSTDTSVARVPTTTVIPAGGTSATFMVASVAHSRVRGNRKTHIQASAPGFVPARVLLTATDMAKPALRLTIRPRRFSENAGANAATGYITRNTLDASRQQPLVVNLQSTDTSEARVPATVTIPAGQQNATFPISAVSDKTRAARGFKKLHIVATATGFTSARAEIVVMDVPAAAKAGASKR